ncbi:demethylspheroidene O-methyltransferase [Palleronia aestuarii]|uniref:Demethylspheroidene O-methyltransferase n=1 Tax=Palleronia aestuarii TaxID=568105 RepID=A0A2W7MV55_9RHOB|nr:methyltransferase [Palleronia aestuarii]PZX11423.1 demethylspheroidene O-methyltransferase [Palleronia aestuarii]
MADRDAGLKGRLNRLAGRPGFQRLAARLPFVRGHVRREGEAIFDLVAGFVQSQALAALVELRVLHLLRDGAETASALAPRLGMEAGRAEILLRAGVAMGLLDLRGGRYRTSLRGAALIGVPGLEAMISHHEVLYRDLADPVAFFRGETKTELAGFWPYVLGGEGGATEAARYSALMAESQAMVAEETLDAVSLRGVGRLMDVGGGTGVFLEHAARRARGMTLALFDLPAVAEAARVRLAAAGLGERAAIHPGSFRDDPLPAGADAISLVRVLYDHDDATVAALLAKVRALLPPGGRVIVSEPMTGGPRPNVSGDIYFAIYCLAMRTGRARSAGEVAAFLERAGFDQITAHKPRRAFVTTVVEARVPQ